MYLLANTFQVHYIKSAVHKRHKRSPNTDNYTLYSIEKKTLSFWSEYGHFRYAQIFQSWRFHPRLTSRFLAQASQLKSLQRHADRTCPRFHQKGCPAYIHLKIASCRRDWCGRRGAGTRGWKVPESQVSETKRQNRACTTQCGFNAICGASFLEASSCCWYNQYWIWLYGQFSHTVEFQDLYPCLWSIQSCSLSKNATSHSLSREAETSAFTINHWEWKVHRCMDKILYQVSGSMQNVIHVWSSI